MTGEERAFLEAIRRAKADDTPRLVYADWLDDQGRHAEAEFIRVQCDIARTRADKSDGCRLLPQNTCSGQNGAASRLGLGPAEWCDVCAAKVPLLERERDLWDALWPTLAAGLPRIDEAPALHPGCVVSCGLGAAAAVRYTVRRGFVAAVHADPAAFLPHAEAVVAACPGLERVELSRYGLLAEDDDSTFAVTLSAGDWEWVWPASQWERVAAGRRLTSAMLLSDWLGVPVVLGSHASLEGED